MAIGKGLRGTALCFWPFVVTLYSCLPLLPPPSSVLLRRLPVISHPVVTAPSPSSPSLSDLELRSFFISPSSATDVATPHPSPYTLNSTRYQQSHWRSPPLVLTSQSCSSAQPLPRLLETPPSVAEQCLLVRSRQRTEAANNLPSRNRSQHLGLCTHPQLVSGHCALIYNRLSPVYTAAARALKCQAHVHSCYPW